MPDTFKDRAITPAPRQATMGPLAKTRGAKTLVIDKTAPPVEVEFLRDLLLQTGGQLLSAKMSASDLADKCAIIVSAEAYLQRSEIDLKLTEQSQRPSLV